jgi:orotate phosphoribosyltransferase
MKQARILELFKSGGALMQGHFELSSGLHSGQYLQCALLLQNPAYAGKLCGQLASRFREDNVSVVIGPAMGGILVSYEVARALGTRSIFAERENGRMALRRGFTINKGDRVLVVEDVVTTGKSTSEVLEVVRGSGADLIGVGALVNRSRGIDFGTKFISLVDMDIAAFDPEDCPLCKDGIPLKKPGSRKR